MQNKSHVILVVEDDPAIRESFCRILKKVGYTVATTCDGQEALDYLAKNTPPTVILLDYRMPRMSGEDFRTEQLKDALLAKIPTILVSAGSMNPVDLAKLKIKYVIEKPFHIPNLLKLVSQFYANHNPA